MHRKKDLFNSNYYGWLQYAGRVARGRPRIEFHSLTIYFSEKNTFEQNDRLIGCGCTGRIPEAGRPLFTVALEVPAEFG